VFPVSVNFSQLEDQYEDNKASFEVSDNGLESLRQEENFAYEEMMVQILCNLDIREKLIFLYQILRDQGHNIDHGAFAKTVHLSRRQYMRALDDVRLKVMLYMVGYKQQGNGHKDK